MVNTFLPYSNFKKVATTLDMKRLGKQRVEAMQIINILSKSNETVQGDKTRQPGWINHPAVKMWSGYVDCLKYYCNTMIYEWIRRGYKNTMTIYDNIPDENNIIYPWWFGNEDFHYSHQASLIRKHPDFYTSVFNTLPGKYNNLGYVWPKIIDGKQTLDFAPIGDFAPHKKNKLKLEQSEKPIRVLSKRKLPDKEWLNENAVDDNGDNYYTSIPHVRLPVSLVSFLCSDQKHLRRAYT